MAYKYLWDDLNPDDPNPDVLEPVSGYLITGNTNPN